MPTIEMLPIGSIVKLNNAEKKLMVFGFLPSHPNKPDAVFDYIGVPYPEGHLSMLLHIPFNHSDIESVVFRGYEDEEYHALMELLSTAQNDMTQTDESDQNSSGE